MYAARPQRVRHDGFLAYAFFVGALLYLAVHMGAMMVGWRITALVAVALLWVVLCCWSWAHATGRIGGRR
ncbi:MAG: hypothetical protein MUQ56_08765 [Thermoleophilia bacterium]|nr:hypothetical protein [Thermoleophilia bacterium]